MSTRPLLCGRGSMRDQILAPWGARKGRRHGQHPPRVGFQPGTLCVGWSRHRRPGHSMNAVLVVENDPDQRQRIVDYLESYGLVATSVETHASARAVLARNTYAAIVLDLTVQGEAGLAMVRELVARGGPPILVTSRRDDEVERVVALDMGVDDYLVKPYGLRELLSRVRAIQRRVGGPRRRGAGRHLARFDEWTVDLPAHRLLPVDGEPIELTSGELSVLRAFLDHPHRVLHRHELIALTRHGDGAIFDRAIDVLVSRLRRKLRARPGHHYIQTIRGQGYLFASTVDWSGT